MNLSSLDEQKEHESLPQDGVKKHASEKMKIKNELSILVGLLLGSMLLFKLLFWKEDFLVVVKVVGSLYVVYLFPGFSIMYYWSEELDFLERFIIGFPVGAAVVGSFGFLFGLINIPMKIHIWIIPIVCYLLSIIFVLKKCASKEKQ